jgi:dimethylargininase
MFTKAIVRKMPDSYVNCISSHPEQQNLNLQSAKEQHDKYVQTLRELGIEIISLSPLDTYPDSCFVEDTAIIHKSKAVITQMGAPSRRGEGDTIADVLKDYFTLKFIHDPGIIEGGDVLHFKDKLVSGLSQRTNKEGIDQTASFLDVKIDFIPDPSIVHLKSYISYLDNNSILVANKYASHEILSGYTKIIVPEKEVYACNALSINGTIIMANGFPKTEQLLRQNDFDLIKLETSEMQKCEGSLTCLSLLF